MLFEINREELDKVLAGYKPHRHTKKAIQAFQKDIADIEKYAESIEKRKAETQLQLTKVLADMEATFEIGERIYLQNEQDHLVKELQALDVYLEECTERRTQVRLSHAPAVAQAIDKDRSELSADFNEEMNKAVRIVLSETMDCVVDVSKMLEAEQKEFEHDVYNCLAGDEVVIDTYRFQNKRVSAETPLEVGYLNITHSDFLQAKSGHNTVKSNSFIVRNYCEEGGNA
ncbi:metalloendopeptidase [Bacillus toyonensis]|uniref:metalloendopeptidase n=1 Tax=Bacillus toyonensis TaxID=155322 RepID=UPI000BEE7142|nr:metalloendopeptidase [Bacillus toyonensis]PEF81839.1 metalloendopeptidase [Bacillus toyonensis]PFY26446.1 metalloendopeptidase [Bacillus toyonensis]PHC05872.1 metalloendopeptidase [Bacillus toyonensis]PHE32902.1 metalloendopeptidase [Bacillus toyonensis]